MRIGFVGTGVIAWAHAIGLQAMIRADLLDAAVVAVHDLDDERAQGFAAVNGATAVSSLAEVLKSCDALSVCTPTSSHRVAVEAAAARGLPVFCEKPLATDLSGAESLAATVAGAGVPAQVGLVLRSRRRVPCSAGGARLGELGAPMAAIFRDDAVLPRAGDVRIDLARDVAVGRRWMSHRALHPRPRHPPLLSGRGHRGDGAHDEFLRARGGRGPGDGVSALRVGGLGRAREHLARHLEPAAPPGGSRCSATRAWRGSTTTISRRSTSRPAVAPRSSRARHPVGCTIWPSATTRSAWP